MRRRRLAWTLCGASVALLIPVVVLILLNRSVHGIWSDIEVQHLVGGFIAVGVGFVLATRRPDNAVGWLLLVSAGILAGVYPAWRAASLAIARTLREEAVA